MQNFLEVFDLGVSYHNIKSPNIGLHLPFRRRAPLKKEIEKLQFIKTW